MGFLLQTTVELAILIQLTIVPKIVREFGAVLQNLMNVTYAGVIILYVQVVMVCQIVDWT